jgi:hypothetical protein
MSKSSQAEYEARKALRRSQDKSGKEPSPLELLDMADRFVTAFERIADALEANPAKAKTGIRVTD